MAGENSDTGDKIRQQSAPESTGKRLRIMSDEWSAYEGAAIVLN